MSLITPCLWFDGQAEEAARFYCGIFPDSEIISVVPAPEGAPDGTGAAMVVEFSLRGQRFTGLNGGPYFTFSEAVSFQIHCADQQEVDHYWDALTEGGSEQPCGWLKDRFGLSWQVVPTPALEPLASPDRARAKRAFAAIMTMRKIDIAAVLAAADATD